MRFLIVTPLVPPEPGGPSYYSVSLQEAFKKAGHEADLIAFKEVRQWPTGVRHLMFLYKVLLRALKADTLIILDTVSVALPAVLAGWVLGKKTIIRTGGDFVWEHYVERTGEKIKLSEFYKAGKRSASLSSKENVLVWIQKYVVFKLADALVFSTTWQRGIWREPYGLHESKMYVIENAYNIPLEKAVRDSVVPMFVWVGRRRVLKNTELLQVAFREFQKKCPKYSLECLSGVERNIVQDALKNAYALVLPSVSEVSPNIVAEAIALGVPVLATDDCGLRGRFGGAVLWVDMVDLDQFERKLLSLTDVIFYKNQVQQIMSYHNMRSYDKLAGEFILMCTQ